MYVLIVIFFQGGSVSPNSGFSQEFATREACYHALEDVRREVQRQAGGERRLVVRCVSKDRAAS